MLSKHDSIQRDQLEMITLDQLVPPNHLKSGDTAYLANTCGRSRSSASSSRCKNYICET